MQPSARALGKKEKRRPSPEGAKEELFDSSA